jgi:hypothetical protein
LILILIALPLRSEEKKVIENLKEITDADRKTNWDNLTADEKWESFKTDYNCYIRLKKLYDKKDSNETILIDNLDKTNKLLSQKELKNSIGLFILAGLSYNNLTQKLNADCYAGLSYKKYFAWNRAYIEFGAAFKFYDSFGGALQFGLGINF